MQAIHVAQLGVMGLLHVFHGWNHALTQINISSGMVIIIQKQGIQWQPPFVSTLLNFVLLLALRTSYKFKSIMLSY